MQQLYFPYASEWRKWLAANHDKSEGVWLVFYKKETGEATMTYDEAVEEALCFGWIDSIIKKLDERRYMRKFTPRKDKSKWSAYNKRRVAKLIKAGRMMQVGLAKVETAKQNGMWEKPDRPQIPVELPADFETALSQIPQAQENFEALAPSYQKQYIGWITVAKRAETKNKRIKEAIALLEKGEKLGMR